MADIWYQVRKNVTDIRRTLPQGVIGPGFNDDFGDTYGTIYGFTGDGFSPRELRDYVEDIRSRLLLVPDVSKIEILGGQDEQIFLEFSTARLAALGLSYTAFINELQAQNIVRPAGVVQTDQERIFLRVSGAFDSERDIEGVNFTVGDRIIPLRDIATVRRGFSDPPDPLFHINGKAGIGLAIAMRDGGDILALGANLKKAMRDITADLPVGIEPFLVSNQAETVDIAINDFMESLWQAILIILAASFVSLGVRPGSVVAIAIPLTLAIVFAVMEIVGIDLQRISLGALIIALTLLVDDAMTTVDAIAAPPRRGGLQGGGRDLRLPHAGRADARRHADHHRGLRADRLRAQQRGRVHVLDLRGRGDRAGRLVARRGDVRAGHRHGDPQGAQAGAATRRRDRCCAPTGRCWSARCACSG